jgi:hypothetical protein
MPYGTVNAEQMTTQSGYTLGAGNATSYKNRAINGNMTIDQRNAGASVVLSSGAAYAADRFQGYNQNSGAYTIQQVADAPAGFKYSDKITTTTAGSTGTASWTSFVQHKIEGYNIADLGAGTASAQTITLSFWVKSSLTGTMPVVFLNDVDRLYATTYTINTANTWEQKTVTVTLSTSGTWNSTNGRGLLITWGLGSGSTYTTSTLNAWQNLDGLYFTTGAVAVGGTLNATWQLTGVQVEVGTVATSFDFRPYGTELQLCQRYYQKTYPQGSVPGNTSGSQAGALWSPVPTTNSYNIIGNWNFAAVMRATPTITTYNPTTGSTSTFIGDGSDFTPVGVTAIGDRSAAIYANNVSVSTAVFVSVHATASAEL